MYDFKAISGTKRTVRTLEVSVRRGWTVYIIDIYWKYTASKWMKDNNK